ncbi:unnamed protein product [Closterium sp. Naga37s-1]|nr:unnamed protein product [Closterium sp. Naga37s-1]
MSAKWPGYTLTGGNPMYPVLRVWNTSNVVSLNVNYHLAVTESSPECTTVPELGKAVTCPAISIHRSYGVQIGKDVRHGAWECCWTHSRSSFSPTRLQARSCLHAPSYAIYLSPLQGNIFGRVDVLRSMSVRLDSLTVTGVASFNRSPGVIRVALSGYGPGLLKSNIVISNNEVYAEEVQQEPVRYMVWGSELSLNSICCSFLAHYPHSPLQPYLSLLPLLPSYLHSPICLFILTTPSSPLSPLPPYPHSPHCPLIPTLPIALLSPLAPFASYPHSPHCPLILTLPLAPSSPLPPRLPALLSRHWVNTPILLHKGAVGVTVTNNYVHDYIFAGIKCGADVHYSFACMLARINSNLVVSSGRNLNGDHDSAGIYFYTHWFSPGNSALCNYVFNGDHCYYLDHCTSGVLVRGGACVNTYDGMKVNNGKRNVIESVAMKGTQGSLGWTSCFTVTVNNCLKDPGNYWEAMRVKYYNSARINRVSGSKAGG